MQPPPPEQEQALLPLQLPAGSCQLPAKPLATGRARGRRDGARRAAGTAWSTLVFINPCSAPRTSLPRQAARGFDARKTNHLSSKRHVCAFRATGSARHALCAAHWESAVGPRGSPSTEPPASCLKTPARCMKGFKNQNRALRRHERDPTVVCSTSSLLG